MNVEIQFLVQMFVKHGHKIIFLEILVKEYNNSNKKKDNYTNSKRKSRGHLILDQKLGKN